MSQGWGVVLGIHTRFPLKQRVRTGYFEECIEVAKGVWASAFERSQVSVASGTSKHEFPNIPSVIRDLRFGAQGL